jgi:tetratricopeptide (TPR) repeat protein
MKKNYQIVSKVVLLAFLISISAMIKGQNTNLDDNDKCYYQWYLDLNAGITQNHCDLQEGSWHLDMLNGDEMDFGFGARLGKHISPVFTIYGSLINAPLKGYRERRDLRFESELTDYILGTTVNFSNLFFKYNPKRRLTVYGTTGIGFVDFISKSYVLEDKTIKNPSGVPTPYLKGDLYNQYGKSGDRTTETMVPTGIGLDYKLSNRWDVLFETTIRWFDSDKLDALISGNKNDAYYYTFLGLTYNFWRPKEKCKIILETEPTILALVGDSVPVEVKGTIPTCFNSKAVVEFTPVLKYGNQTKKLKTIWLEGTEVAQEFKKPGAIQISPTGGTFTFKDKVKYEPGMDVCELFVEPMASISGKPPFSLLDRKVADGLVLTAKRVQSDEEFLSTGHDYVKEKTAKQMGIIYFVVNKYDLNFNYILNKDMKATLMLKSLNEFITRGWTIRDIDIHAWASPEGEESLNQGLSENRSKAGKKYIEDQYNQYIKKRAKEEKVKEETIAQTLNINLSAHGEDWDGFMKAVQASEIKDKNIIMNVVNSQSDVAKREQEIRNMTVIYKEIEKDILPPLRRAEITVTCLEPGKTDAEIAELATSSPKDLDNAQLLYAATLTNDLETQLKIYKAATELFPGDWRAFNNAGYVLMRQGKTAEAKTYFEKAKAIAANNGTVLYNLGVVAAKEKDWAKAKSYYQSAQQQGVDVGYNLGVVKIVEGNYSGAASSLSAKKCTYNLGLAQLLSANYTAAGTTLNCAPKNAQTYYLMAVLGARTGNDAMLYENLKKAINENPDYKAQAQADREFIKYFNNPDFQNATR